MQPDRALQYLKTISERGKSYVDSLKRSWEASKGEADMPDSSLYIDLEEYLDEGRAEEHAQMLAETVAGEHDYQRAGGLNGKEYAWVDTGLFTNEFVMSVEGGAISYNPEKVSRSEFKDAAVEKAESWEGIDRALSGR